MSKRNELSTLVPGAILVHELDDTLTFHSGDEFSRLIFVTAGSSKHCYRDYEYGDMNEVIESNAVDIFAGDLLSWGLHMFMEVDDFEDWVSNMKFMIESNPDLQKKIEIDSDEQYGTIDRFRKYKGLQVANAIIRHANLILMGIETGKFRIPKNVKKTYKLVADYRRKKKSEELMELIYDKQDISVRSSTSEEEKSILHEEIASLEKEVNDLNTPASDEEIDQLINTELIGTLKRIAAIEPFGFIDSMIEEDIRRYQRYLKKKEQEESDQSEADAETEADVETDVETDVDVDTDGETDVETEADVDTDGETDGETEADGDIETDGETENEEEKPSRYPYLPYLGPNACY